MEIIEEIPADARRADVPAIFNAFRQEAEKLKQTALTINVTDINDKAGMKLARETRLALRQIRLATEARRVELKEDALREGQRIDKAAKEVKDAIASLENRLEEQEKFIEIETARIQMELRQKRSSEIAPYLAFHVSADYGKMSEEEYVAMFNGAKAEHERREAEALKAEEERLQREKEAAEERERIRVENDRLKREAEERQRQEAIERQRIEEERQKEREEAERRQKEADAAAKAERDKLEAQHRAERERLAKEQAEKDRIAAEERRKEQERITIAEKARREAERLLAEQKAAEGRKRQAEAEAAAKKAAAEAEEKRRATMAPVAEKLRTFGDQIMALQIPTMEDKALSGEILRRKNDFAEWVFGQAHSISPKQEAFDY